MSRPTEVDLTVPGAAWREIAMPAANLAFLATRLDSVEGELAMHGRFPAGFTRPVAGGYQVPEEFLVIEGELVVSGTTYRRGDLTYVPARHLRTDMSSADGCTVLAWFGGPAIFHTEDELDGGHWEGLVSVSVLEGRGPLLVARDIEWATTAGAVGPGVSDLVEDGLRRWRRVSGPTTAVPPALARKRA